MKLELVQFPYTKARPTVCLEGWAIAGPNPFGVGKTLWEYEIKDSDIDRIEKLIHVYRKSQKNQNKIKCDRCGSKFIPIEDRSSVLSGVAKCPNCGLYTVIKGE